MQLQSRKFTPSRAQDPLTYNFIKSVNEKHRQETQFCVYHQEEQSAWLKEWDQEVLVQKNSSHTLYCKTLVFFLFVFFPSPSSAQTEQHCSSKEGGERWQLCKKIFLRIIIIRINNNDKRNKNIPNRQTQSPQYKTRFCHGHNNQRKVVFFFFLFFF